MFLEKVKGKDKLLMLMSNIFISIDEYRNRIKGLSMKYQLTLSKELLFSD